MAQLHAEQFERLVLPHLNDAYSLACYQGVSRSHRAPRVAGSVVQGNEHCHRGSDRHHHVSARSRS